MTNRHWSTQDVPARHQFAYWREAVCEAVMNVATEDPADDDFSGNIACAGYGELRFATFTSSAHRIVRRPPHIGRSSHAHYLVSLQRSGTGRMEQNGASCELQAGDIGIVDGKIAEVRPGFAAEGETMDLQGRLVSPGLIETHIHLDKSGILDRCRADKGDLEEAKGKADTDRAATLRQRLKQTGR